MTTRSTVHSGLIQIGVLPQLVPSQVCFTCGVCCHFPKQDSFLRPYFTEEEIRQAVAAGIDPSWFPNPAGSQIQLAPNSSGEGYLCPAFDPATAHCRIYKARPLDCQIYPLAVMWAPPTAAGERQPAIGDGRESSPLPMAHRPLPAASGEGMEVVLGWDTKCPFLNAGERQSAIGNGPESSPSPIAHDPLPGLSAYADRVAKLIEERYVETYAAHRGLIGRFQEDVIILRKLPALTARLTNRAEGRGQRTEEKPVARAQSLVLSPQSLSLEERPRFEAAAANVETELAAYAFVPHYIWRELFTYSWAEIAGHFCLFAEYADGLYMPLPPLPGGWRSEVRGLRQDSASKTSTPSGLQPPTSNLYQEIVDRCFAHMKERNGGSAVSRIENIPEEWNSLFEGLGYRLIPKDPDYLYRTSDLVSLAGDRYKSPRAACNRFERDHRYEWRAFREQDREACLSLYRRWADQQGQRGLSAAAAHMLRDSKSAHRQALEHAGHLGLEGRVVLVDGVIRAYTFGYARTASLWCVLLEVSDRTVPGLAQWTFREFCREAASHGYEHVNTMDAAGLPELARSKDAYGPVRKVSSFIATR